MLIKSENKMVEVKLQGDWLFLGFGVKQPDGTLNTFFLRTKLAWVDGDVGTHTPLDTNNFPCEFLGCDCTYDGYKTEKPLELLKSDGNEIFEFLEKV